MKVAIAADHGGFPLKEALLPFIESLGHEVIDLGAHQYDAIDDYPDFARYVGQAIQHEQVERGIIICGSGVGASVASNKIKSVRAAVCHDGYSAGQGVEHDDMNVLCLGSRVIGVATGELVVTAFLAASFSGEERHLRRLEKVKAIEAAGEFKV